MSVLKFLGLAGTESDSSDVGGPDAAADTDTMRRIAAQLEELDEGQARYLAAFAYILGRVAHADSEFSDEETRKMEEVVQGLGHLTGAQAALVVEIAKSQVRLSGPPTTSWSCGGSRRWRRPSSASSCSTASLAYRPRTTRSRRLKRDRPGRSRKSSG